MVFFGRGQVAREGGGDSCGSAEQGHAALNPDSGSNEFLGKRAQRGSIFPPPPIEARPTTDLSSAAQAPSRFN
jgi:hypothetical protein